MKKYLFIGFSLLMACSGNNTSQEYMSSLSIQDGQVGEFKIGDPIPAIGQFDGYEIYAASETISEEGDTYEKPFHTLSADKQDKIRFEFTYDANSSKFIPIIGEILITTEECKTIKGIGVGSTLTDFYKTYPDYQLGFTYISGMFTLESSELSVQFILDGEDYIGGKFNNMTDYEVLRSTDFKPDAKISSIRIYKSSAESSGNVDAMDMSLVRELEKTLIDSVEFIDQSVNYPYPIVRFYHNADRFLKKIWRRTESESGDVVTEANFYFHDNGNTSFATYLIDILPTSYSATLEIAVNSGEKTILKAVELKNGKKVEVEPSTVADQLDKTFFLKTNRQMEVQIGITLVRPEDFIANKEDVFEAEGGMISGSDRFLESKLSSSINRYTYEKYVVSEIPDTEANGNIIYYKTRNQRDSVKIPYQESAFFIGMWKDFIILDYGTGVARNLSIWNVNQKKVVYSTPYVLINIVTDQLIITRTIQDPSARKWLPACDEEKAVGQGVDYSEVVKISLKTLEENITGQVFCSVAQ